MIVHLNGQLLPRDQAQISVFDRGFIFGDGIYEGLRSVVIRGQRRVIGKNRHARRMQAGLDAIGIRFDARTLGPLTDKLLDANGLDNAFIYWQVTRGTPLPGMPVRSRVPGAAPGGPAVAGMPPTIFGYATSWPGLEANAAPAIKPATTQNDLRWAKGDIKSISLLGNILASLASAEHGGEEAIMIRQTPAGKLVTEGTYTNVAIVTDRGEVATPSLESAPMLNGITRQILLHAAPQVVQRPVRAEELITAREVLLIGTTTMVTTVSPLDGRAMSTGGPGPIARELLRTLVQAIERGEDDIAS